jgi:hypothetical protein
MNGLKSLAVALILCLAFYTAQATSQSLPQPPNMMDTLNREAAATDSAAIRVYSKHLVSFLPRNLSGPDGAAANIYLNSFSDRLANAEKSARQGKRKLISEEAIAEAFNDLMRQTGAPPSLKADLESVKLARKGWEKKLPAIISREKNGTYCNPGEAIWVLSILIGNIGAHYPLPLHPGEPQVLGDRPPVDLHLLQYFSSHSPNEDAHVIDKLAKSLGI